VPVKWDIPDAGLLLPQGWSAKKDKSDEASSTYTVTIPGDAMQPISPGYAILPFPPPLVEVPIRVKADGYTFTMREPVQCTRATTTGIATYSLELVPAVTLTVEPREAMVPLERSSEPIKLLARVRYHGTKAEKISVGLDAPQGWSAEPIAPLEFSGAGDQLVRFVVTPPARPTPGAYDLKPYAKIGEKVFRTSLEPIPTLATRDWSEPTNAAVHVMDLVVPPHLHVGYVAADNDPLPERLREIGIQVDLLDEVALSFDDLGHYDAIVVGIRAYELRPDLVRANNRLLKYVSAGGSLVVQYQRDFAWNDVSLAPYPAKMPEDTSRVTDANSPVRFLAPENPLLNSPNKISHADFNGWVQERGLYFWSTFDPHYQTVLGLIDPGEPEANGALVYAKYGNGVYVYTGLSFFRELPAGVPGAYRLFVNLLSQTRHTASSD
jgi:hypothetical protein